MDDIIKEGIQNKIHVYFTEESGLCGISVKAETVDKIVVKDGFLKIHDSYDEGWHCYNLSCIKHYHIPD